VRSHSRQRHADVSVMTLASVSMFFPLQKGQPVGRVKSFWNRDSGTTHPTPARRSGRSRV